MAEQGETLDHVIEMQVNDEVLVERIVGRAAEAVAAGGDCACGRQRRKPEDPLDGVLQANVSADRVLPCKGMLKGVDGLATMDGVKAEIAGVLDAKSRFRAFRGPIDASRQTAPNHPYL